MSCAMNVRLFHLCNISLTFYQAQKQNEFAFSQTSDRDHQYCDTRKVASNNFDSTHKCGGLLLKMVDILNPNLDIVVIATAFERGSITEKIPKSYTHPCNLKLTRHHFKIEIFEPPKAATTDSYFTRM